MVVVVVVVAVVVVRVVVDGLGVVVCNKSVAIMVQILGAGEEKYPLLRFIELNRRFYVSALRQPFLGFFKFHFFLFCTHCF